MFHSSRQSFGNRPYRVERRQASLLFSPPIAMPEGQAGGQPL